MMVTFGSSARDDGFDHGEPIVIGLVNNMPDTALRATEQQYCELLSQAARDRAVSLRFFFLPGLPRGPEAQAHLRRRYSEIGELWEAHLDGLIVTGTEPRAAALSDEPYWPVLANLVDWAEEHTISTVWSCLAAHAAALRNDGICRRRFNQKLFGVFDCAKAADHPILIGAPARWRVPHARYNDLAEEDLAARGYCILSRSDAAGADMFVKQRNSLFVFLQGHPEYDSGALLREYRRDVRRFLGGQSDGYPEMPRAYFDDDTEASLVALKARALRDRDPNVLRDFPDVWAEEKLACDWRQLAVHLYTNWLSYVVDQKYARRPRARLE
jgi:homoserine O-succinyltransferase